MLHKGDKYRDVDGTVFRYLVPWMTLIFTISLLI